MKIVPFLTIQDAAAYVYASNRAWVVDAWANWLGPNPLVIV